MSLRLDNNSERPKRRFGILGPVILLLVVIVLAGGGWYYFFGRKPSIAFSVPLKTDGGSGDEDEDTGFAFDVRSWDLGENRVLVMGGGELKLCDLAERKVRWSVKLPALVEADPGWQEAINSRFVKLEQWAGELAQKRAAVSAPNTDPKAVEEFNAEAKKYSAELTAARADNAKVPPPRPARKVSDDEDDVDWPEELPGHLPAGTIKEKLNTARLVAATAAAQTNAAQEIPSTFAPRKTASTTAAPAQPKIAPPAKPPVKPGAKPTQQQLNSVVTEDIQMLRGRIAKRAKSLADMDKTIAAKTKTAKTDLAKEEVKQWQAKRAALAAEQHADETAVAKAIGGAAPPPLVKPGVAAPAAAVAATAPAAKPAPAAPAPAPAPASASPGLAEALEAAGDFFSPSNAVEAAILGEYVWLVDRSRALGFALADGSLKTNVRLAGNASHVFPHESGIFIVADAGAQARQITRIDPAGAPSSIYFAAPKRSAGMAMESTGDGVQLDIRPHTVEFTGGGGSLARVDIRLIERKTRKQDLIKPGAEKALTQAAANAPAHSLDEATSIMKMMEIDSARAFGQATQEIDESTYEVTVTRPFASTAPPLTERFQGRVEVLSTPSLDLIAGGTRLVALDRNNKKLWEAKLGAAIPDHDAQWDEGAAPSCVERDGKLFLADGAFLTAFQPTTGQVLWRLPSVGIRKFVFDGEGNLYVRTDNLSVDSLHYLITAETEVPTCTVLKVSAADGKILWDAPKFEDVWASGDHVYAYREARNPGDLENQVFDPGKVPEARVRFYKLSRSDGKPVWDWFQTRRPIHVVPAGKTMAILFRDELQVIHSIAL